VEARHRSGRVWLPRTIQGVVARIARRLLALAAAIWPN